ncbi:MAG: ABC transporter substrate-binding protein [Balneolaceae bacterium]|nr:ABC transporter substrate-binding protein [Balneolaceae bacterium]
MMKKLSFLPLILLVALYGEFTQAQEIKHYADTPEELLPYSQFLEPYMLFFDESQPYLGPGRDGNAPADLKTVKIGFVAPLEGSYDDDYGQSMLKGATLALEEANAQGGYQGLPYEILVKNDVGLWGSTGNEIVDLYDKGVWAIVGSIDGNNSHVALRVVLKLEMPMVNTTSTDPTLTETRIPWMVRCISDDRQNNYALAKQIFEKEGLENVAILRANDRYGRLGVKIFQESAIRLGHPVRIHLNYVPGAEDIDPQLEKIRNSDSEAVLIWGNDEDAAKIVNRMRDMGMNHKVFGSDRLVTDRFLERTGENAEGVVAIFPYNPQSQDPTYLRFVQNYRERYGSEPDLFAAHTYDGMKMLIQSIEEAGLNHVRIRDELTSIRKYQGVTGEIILDTTWNDVGKVWLMEVENGKFVVKYPSK